jgi:hypothetical protein
MRFPELRRASFRRPGYDCRRECKHTPKGDHGWHGDEWIYVVGDEEGALVLTIFANEFEGDPALTAELRRGASERSQRACGSDLTLHTRFPIDVEHVREAAQGTKCEYVVGRCFTAWTSARQADDFFTEHGADTFDQSIAFWDAFSERFLELMADARARRVDTTHAQCPTCAGAGVVAKVPS